MKSSSQPAQRFNHINEVNSQSLSASMPADAAASNQETAMKQ